jgi:hypothetical protein
MCSLPSLRQSRPSRTTQRQQTVRKTPIESGGTQTETATTTQDYQQNTGRRSSRSGRVRAYSPPRMGANTASGVGLLEAEFLGALAILVLIFFTGEDTYGSKVMSLMKRGTLISLLFFILALIAGTGSNAAKVSKGIGALVVVATLLNLPVSKDSSGKVTGLSLFTDLDTFLKSDWVGTTEHGTDVGSADNPTSGGGTALGAASGAVQRITSIIETFGLGFIK